MGRQDLAHRSLGQAGEARVAGTQSVVAGVRRQQTGPPQLVRVAELRRLCAGQPNKPRFWPLPWSLPHRRCGRGRPEPPIPPSSAARCKQRVTVYWLTRMPAPRRRPKARRDRPELCHELDTVGRFRARSSDLNQRSVLIDVHRQGNDPSCSDHGFSPAMPDASYHTCGDPIIITTY